MSLPPVVMRKLDFRYTIHIAKIRELSQMDTSNFFLKQLPRLERQHALKLCFEAVRFIRGALETDVGIGANKEESAITCSIAFRKGLGSWKDFHREHA